MPSRSRGFARRQYRENNEGGGPVTTATPVVLPKGAASNFCPFRRLEMATDFRCIHCLGGQKVHTGSVLGFSGDLGSDYEPSRKLEQGLSVKFAEIPALRSAGLHIDTAGRPAQYQFLSIKEGNSRARLPIHKPFFRRVETISVQRNLRRGFQYSSKRK